MLEPFQAPDEILRRPRLDQERRDAEEPGHAGELGRCPVRVNGNAHRAGLGHGESRLQVLYAIADDDPDEVALADMERQEALGEPVGPALKLSVGDRPPGIPGGHLLGKPGGMNSR